MSRSRKSIVGALSDVDGAAITVRQDRCAKVRNRNVACLKCAEACTSGCISLVDDELVVDASKCVGCGTCATVCPTCALEARNPSDAELLRACKAARRGGRVAIACEQVRKAASGLLDEGSFASPVCLGRVDESLVVQLAAAGVEEVALVCGDCSRCVQEHGMATARLVAESSNALIDAFGGKARVKVVTEMPEECVAPGCAADDVRAAMKDYFSVVRGAEPVRSGEEASGDADGREAGDFPLPHVMSDGTLPHFVPDRRERILDALSSIGEPSEGRLPSRLWGCVVIDGERCSSCRMCATFCPTGAIRKFDDEDGTFGVLHFPAECVKCGSCRDICPEHAIRILDEVDADCLLGGERHRYAMRPRSVELNSPHQILDSARTRMEGDVYER